MLGGKQACRRLVHDGVGDGHKEEYYEVEDQRFLDGEGFGEKMLKKELEGPRKPSSRRSVDAIAKELGKLSVSKLTCFEVPIEAGQYRRRVR